MQVKLLEKKNFSFNKIQKHEKQILELEQKFSAELASMKAQN